MAEDAVARHRLVGPAGVTLHAGGGRVAVGQRELTVLEGRAFPCRHGVTLQAVRRESARHVPRRLLIVRVVARRAVRRDRVEDAGGVTRDALDARVSTIKREERVLECGSHPTGDSVTLRAFHRETAGDVAGRLLVVRVVTGRAV